MAISVVMPALEMAQETGKLISWLKKEGDTVAKGEMLLEIETDKAVMEIESPGDGILAGVSAQPGAEVPVGQTIAWIVSAGEAPPTENAPTVTGRRSDSTKVDSSRIGASPDATKPAMRETRVSPKARRLAKEQGIDLDTVRGTGPGGEILADDILAAAKAAARPLPPAETSTGAAPGAALSLSAVAKLMASRTTQSWTTVPHFFVTREVDATQLKAAREHHLASVEKDRGVKLTLTDLLISRAGKTLARHPRVNASWVGDTIVLNPGIHVALAMAVEEGVVTAVIRDAEKLDVGEIAVQRRDLAERARAGKLRPTDISGATFTISNLGMYNVDSFSAIITPPQAAILAIGRIADRVVVVNGEPGVRPMMSLTLSSDHRVVDGAGAAKFLNDLVVALEKSEG
jgi:pyruvate dehydrogenase E2 component (dihydrolipoamide acetyltransferase)